MDLVKMVIWQTLCILFGYFFLVTSGDTNTTRRYVRGAGSSWGYGVRNGPSSWGGTCETGQQQSPINIQLGNVIVKNFPPFKFEGDYLTKLKFFAKNNGHSVYVVPEDDEVKPVVHGGGLQTKFIFQQLHFHWESEHEFEGKRADMEMHLVHYNSKYSSFAEASTEPDGLAVFAVLYDESKETDNLLENFFGYILDAAAHGDGGGHPSGGVHGNTLPGVDDDSPKERHEVFAIRDLLPRYTSRFFRYQGSLTTPDCGEVVQWTIFINRLPVSSRVLESLRELRDHDGNVLVRNFRPPQKLNGREVFIQINNYDGRPTEEYGKLTNGVSRVNALASVYLLCGCLIVHFRLK